MARVNPRSITAVLNLFSSDLSVARVKERTLEGGHDVSEDKIRARYDRGQPLIREAVLRADRGMVYDNSKFNQPPKQVLVFASGRLIQAEPILPKWVLQVYADDLVFRALSPLAGILLRPIKLMHIIGGAGRQIDGKDRAFADFAVN